MKFKVTGTAKYEYDVDVEDEDIAIGVALDLFREDIEGITYWQDILEWSADEISPQVSVS